MTPREIVESVKRRNIIGRDRCANDRLPHAMAHHICSDIDHLLAIHAAAVEMFEAREKLLSVLDGGERLMEKIANLAALCGWKAEGA